ncbi:hypothetical protein HAX54_013269 [Datura stramonium]|uniref:TF-B3 domain-containing protein n=1 Tax=Datura stramonium TaxID=4076 RepID=A0ABS8TMN2_DATST|nr:hypothetical protein [Datura stramonium]
MPPCFIKEHKNMLAKTCLLKSNVVVGMSWEANIVRKKSNYFICDGDWQQFVVHHQLELGDILLFFLIDKSTFHVLAYNQKCYSNFSGSPLFEELSSSSEEKQDTSRNAKRVKTEPKESSEEEEVESGSEENGPKKIRLSVVNLNNKDPYYEIVVKKSHTFFMTIPMSFARWTGIIDMKRMRLDNGEGKKWGVDVVRKKGSIRITRGWAEFRTHNKIANGQTCRFKLIRGNGGGKNVLQVKMALDLNFVLGLERIESLS